MSEGTKAEMEASPFGALVPEDGIPRQRTFCKVLVFSHIDDNEFKGRLNLSRDVISCETSKTIKGGGQASFTLVPRINYMNYIFPNDYVYVYFDNNDGKGFVKTFFGYVDRIGRSIATSDDGATQTRFQVVCSDFTKAFMRTDIYFNPYLRRRKDILGEFAGTANLGGVALRTKGIAMYGSPADMVMSLLHVAVGFGGQFMLPKSLQRTLRKDLIEANRKTRKKWAVSRLAETIQKSLIAGEGLSATEYEKQVDAEAYWNAKSQLSVGEEPTKKHIEKEKQAIAVKMGLPASYFNNQEFRAAKSIEAAASPSMPAHLLDLIDFRLVEWKAIDGNCTSTTITWQEGPLWSIANGFSNEFINELFCDLRPMEPDPGKGSSSGGSHSKQEKEVSEAGFDTSKDEIGENTGGAVRFSPCVVMREYPFGTIEGVAAPAEVKILKEKNLGMVYIGAIFSQGINKPGRKTVDIPALHAGLLDKGKGQIRATKHLDVNVISIKDIIQEQIGRSDTDHFNLLEVYSDITSGPMNYARFLTQAIQPITQAIGVARHGLRVRKYTTKFGRFGMFLTKGGAVDKSSNRRMIVRWAMMVDHWWQHAAEYMSGTITTRAFPEIRVATRLDIEERRESYYVEGVNHSWSYPGPMTTNFTVTRGQRNDPFPVYVYPQREGFKGDRTDEGRLAEYFLQKDPLATQNCDEILTNMQIGVTDETALGDHTTRVNADKNYTDMPKKSKKKWAKDPKGFLAANSTAPSDYYSIELGKLAASGVQAAAKGLSSGIRKFVSLLSQLATDDRIIKTDSKSVLESLKVGSGTEGGGIKQ